MKMTRMTTTEVVKMMNRILYTTARDTGITLAISLTGLLQTFGQLLITAMCVAVFNTVILPGFVKLGRWFAKKSGKPEDSFDNDIEKALSEIRDEIIRQIEEQRGDKDE